LQHQLDLVGGECAGVGFWPGGIEQIAQHTGVAQLGPQRMRDVRGGRIQAAQQNGKTFHQRDLGTGTVERLEVFQRIDHFHGARHHGVVLHPLVVVVHLPEYAVNLATQGFGLFAKLDII